MALSGTSLRHRAVMFRSLTTRQYWYASTWYWLLVMTENPRAHHTLLASSPAASRNTLCTPICNRVLSEQAQTVWGLLLLSNARALTTHNSDTLYTCKLYIHSSRIADRYSYRQNQTTHLSGQSFGFKHGQATQTRWCSAHRLKLELQRHHGDLQKLATPQILVGRCVQQVHKVLSLDAKQDCSDWQAVLQKIVGNCKKIAPFPRVAVQETGLHATHAMAPSVARETASRVLQANGCKTKHITARAGTAA